MGVGTSSSGTGADANLYFDTRSQNRNNGESVSLRAMPSKAEKSDSSSNEDDNKSLPSESKKFDDGKQEGEKQNDEGEGNKARSSSRTAHIIANAPLTKTALDESTLKVLGNYLRSGNFARSTLEEEEFALFSYKTSQYTSERTRYRQDLLGDDEELYDRVYSEEEYYALGNEFYKKVVTESQDMAGGPKIQMHNKTVNWVKKAAGLQRPYDPLEHHLSDSDGGETDETNAAPRRRLTRGMARNTIVKRGQERMRKEAEGVSALAMAVQELEKERGRPFPSSKIVVSLKSVIA
jgi:hypothetical protein